MLKRMVEFSVVTVAMIAGCSAVPPEVAEVSPTVLYTFKSGVMLDGGDGFDWPSAGSGLLVSAFPGLNFETPDGISFQNDIGNNLFFDDNYLLPDDVVAGNGITGEAMWGSPKPIDNDVSVSEAVVIRISPPVARAAFDFAWVGSVDPGIVSLGVRSAVPADGDEAEIIEMPLNNTFPAGAVFQDVTGFSGRIDLDLESLKTVYGVSLTGGIGFITIFVDAISDEAASTVFAVDNFTTNDADAPADNSGS